MEKILYLIVPCYNEEEVLPETKKRLKEKMVKLIKQKVVSKDSKVVFVNDGSKDKTWSLIEQYHREDNLFRGINLSRNRGHQNALLAGLMTTKNDADIFISMDADLQDDTDVINQFIEAYNKGFEIVYGVRSSRKKDTFFKRNSALFFYKLMKTMGVDIIYNHADYRLMSKKVLNELENFKEVNLFLRGMIPLIGYSSTTVEYERHERFAGESKYPLKKMLNFAFDGITSFSIKPIRMITTTGVCFSALSFLIILIELIRLLCGVNVFINVFILLSIWLVCGIQLIAIGVIGEYVGKAYMESKARPRFIIDKYLND